MNACESLTQQIKVSNKDGGDHLYAIIDMRRNVMVELVTVSGSLYKHAVVYLYLCIMYCVFRAV